MFFHKTSLCLGIIKLLSTKISKKIICPKSLIFNSLRRNISLKKYLYLKNHQRKTQKGTYFLTCVLPSNDHRYVAENRRKQVYVTFQKRLTFTTIIFTFFTILIFKLWISVHPNTNWP